MLDFSILDLHSGFFQVELEETSRTYTTFTTSPCQFMFKRMAQGLRNSPLTFQRLMNSILSGLIGKSVFCFFDDVNIASVFAGSFSHTVSRSVALSSCWLKDQTQQMFVFQTASQIYWSQNR